MQCNGNGHCKAFDEQDPFSPTFCYCDADWADPECRTRRKSQFMAFFLSLFGGLLGVDRFYVGDIGTGIVKLCSLGGCGVLYIWDIVNYGCGQPYATIQRYSDAQGGVSAVSTFRLADDLPRWMFITSAMVWFYAMGFGFSLSSVIKDIRVKRREFMLIQQLEQRMPGLTAIAQDAWMATHYPNARKARMAGAEGYGATAP